MARNIIKLARALKSEITTLAGNQGLAQYEIVYATDTKEIGVVNSDYSITWSGALNYTNIADNLRTATTSLKGLMSSTDKSRLDSLYDVFTNGDNDNYIDTLAELLEIFESYPEGVEIMDALNDKVNKNPAVTPNAGAVKISYDVKGLVTGSSSLAATDIPNLPGSKITSGKIGYAYLPVGMGNNEVAPGTHTHDVTTLSVGSGGAGDILYRNGDGKVDVRSGSFYLTPAQGNAYYLGIGAKAADSNKLDGQPGAYYLNLGNATSLLDIGKIISQSGTADDLVVLQGDGTLTVVSGNRYLTPVSPVMSGTPTAPTAAINTNTTQLATTAFVMNQISVIDGGNL